VQLKQLRLNIQQKVAVEIPMPHRFVYGLLTGFTVIAALPPRVDHLDVVGGLTPSKNGNQEFTKRPGLKTPT
jgi:hypothetical protein